MRRTKMLTSDEMLLTFLVNAAWQIPAILGLAVITSNLLRNGPASYRHVVWVVALIAAVTIPVRSATTHRVTASFGPQIPAVTGLAADPATTPALAQQHISTTPRPAPRSVNFSSTAVSIAVAAYIAVLMFAVIRLVFATRRTVLILRSAQSETLPPALAATWAHCTEAFGVTRAVLLRSSRIQGPVALGVF